MVLEQFDLPTLIRSLFSERGAVAVAVLVLVIGAIAGYLVWRGTKRFLCRQGIDDAVEGTLFEHTANNVGLSTVGILSQLAALAVYLLSVIVALNIARLVDTEFFWIRFTTLLPRLFVAALAVILGLVVGDKAKLVVSDRLKSVKLPEVSIIPEIVKYSIFYIAALIALGQLGVTTAALLVLLAVYTFGLVFLGGLAFKDLLAAGAAGIYLLLSQPYGIGDEVEIDGTRGIVQEINVFVTHVESDDVEHIIPNQRVLKRGIVRIRE
ncbi:mechanosensitive ion channel domain-containing protein [Halapricum hydrolyticum]|uniref:Mechanosensitive ion channel family protein n=1 Tax=Halapricum hydrolyticum TaxID=2979991 RepID=A0AAE3IBM3_9EURY|nr:mechanosensitive ion channel domain-containing protein [Halapricum hydrolyticum]MCU4716900.1 mechanosensitive ion channel family protein [Halapricum hydrolyticum]MCU4725495.1 mechanosensitive ion channel family protein [Halapricum hydrolyticum]